MRGPIVFDPPDDSDVKRRRVKPAALASALGAGLRHIWGDVLRGVRAPQLAAEPRPDVLKLVARCRRLMTEPPPSPPLKGSAPAAHNEYVFARMRFAGTLAGHGSSIAVGFDLWIDGLGLLHLKLDTMPYCPEAAALAIHQRPGSQVDLLDLVGQSAAGHRFSSDSFSISRYRHGSDFELQGDCYDAELVLPRDHLSDSRACCFNHLFRDCRRPRVQTVASGSSPARSHDKHAWLAMVTPDPS